MNPTTRGVNGLVRSPYMPPCMAIGCKTGVVLRLHRHTAPIGRVAPWPRADRQHARETMKTDKQKAKEILRKRKLAAQGLKEKPEGENPLEDPEEKAEEEIGDAAISTEFGLHR